MALYNNGFDWRAEQSKTRAMLAERNKYLGIYTEYERLRVDEAIESRINMTRDRVVQAARAEFDSKLAQHRAAKAAEQAARKREAARWDPARVGMEYSFMRSAFDRAQDVNQARAEYDRAVASGDLHKMRAAAEVFSVARAKWPHDLESNRLAVDAQRLAEQLQTTPEIIEAQARQAKAIDEVVGLQNEIGQTAQELGVHDLQRTIERVHVRSRFDGDSGRFTYELQEPEGVAA